MVKRINTPYELYHEFRNADRDDYSMDGYEFMLEYNDEIDDDVELDVIALCCEWTEYDNYNDFINDYDYLLDDADLDDDYSFDDKVDALVEELYWKTVCRRLENGNIMVRAF